MRGVFTIFCLLLLGLGAAGWGLNLVKIFHSTLWPLTGELVIRIIGVFVVFIGAIVGFF